jgi:hypothetical protein
MAAMEMATLPTAYTMERNRIVLQKMHSLISPGRNEKKN